MLKVEEQVILRFEVFETLEPFLVDLSDTKNGTFRLKGNFFQIVENPIEGQGHFMKLGFVVLTLVSVIRAGFAIELYDFLD